MQKEICLLFLLILIPTSMVFAQNNTNSETFERNQGGLRDSNQQSEQELLLSALNKTLTLVEDIHNKVNNKEFGLEETKNEVRNIETTAGFLEERIIENKIHDEELLSAIQSLQTEIQLLDVHLLKHEEWSSNSAYIGIVSGSIIGGAGALIGVTQFLSNLNKDKLEREKRKKILKQLKENLVDIYDLSQVLEKNPPDLEYLPKLHTWRSLKLRAKVITTIITGGMSLLDSDIIRHSIEFTNFIDTWYDNGISKGRGNYQYIVKNTKWFLDKYFPEHEEEREAFLRHSEEQAKEWEEKMPEEQLDWYEQNYDAELYQDEEEYEGTSR